MTASRILEILYLNKRAISGPRYLTSSILAVTLYSKVMYQNIWLFFFCLDNLPKTSLYQYSNIAWVWIYMLKVLKYHNCFACLHFLQNYTIVKIRICNFCVPLLLKIIYVYFTSVKYFNYVSTFKNEFAMMDVGIWSTSYWPPIV